MDDFSAVELNKYLKTRVLGRKAVILPAVDSTNLEARRMIERGPEDGTVIIADRQTLGRGRRGRVWVSAAGCGLWMTAVVRPRLPLEQLQKMSLMAGLAVCRSVEAITDTTLRPLIKWPNDVLAEGRKLCGILCESAIDPMGDRNVIIGIGINTRTPEAGYGEASGVAISLVQAGQVAGRMRLAAAVLNHMEELLESWQSRGFEGIASGYRRYMIPAGSEVVIVDSGQSRRGKIDGLDDGGGLLVRLETGEVERIISGEISLRGVGGYV